MNRQLVNRVAKVGSLSLLLLGLGACTRDSDDDGLKNSREEVLGTNPKLADTDHDGLNDGREIRLGSDPLAADSDGDGLSDGDEIKYGADPNVVDTDADGYTDRDEVVEGHDPANPKDRIYKGHWPYYFDKETIKGGKIAPGGAEVGKRVGRFQLKDQHGDNVDLFDFYNAGKPVLIDYSGVWCFWCNVMASWLADDGTYSAYYEGWDDEFPGLREGVANGDIYFVTILNGDLTGANPATKKDATEWADKYDSPMIPVLADKDASSIDYMHQAGWPALQYLDKDLKIKVSSPDDWTLAAYAASAALQ